MESAYQWILTSTPIGGYELGESFYAAKQIEKLQLIEDENVHIIEEGTPEKQQQELIAMAGCKERNADKTLVAGHKVTARKNYLKACNYYRTSAVSMRPAGEKQHFDETTDNCQ